MACYPRGCDQGAAWMGGALDTAWTLNLAAVTCAIQVALDVHWQAKLALGSDWEQIV
jgi:hypothetical protein